MNRTASAVIVADDPTVERDALRLLAAHGIAASDRAPGDGLTLLLFDGDAGARVKRIQAIADKHPHARLVVTMPATAGPTLLRGALRAGAQGIVSEEALEEMLVPTVTAVLVGQLVVPSVLRRRLAPRALSYREKQILGLVVAGYTNRQIAEELFVAESTVKTHLSSVFSKLETRSRAETAALILDPEEGYGPAVLGLVPEATRHAA